MDETEETQENSLQKKETASAGSEGTTPTAETKTQYTQEEVDKLLQADRIKRGREDKSLSDRKAELDAQQESMRDGLAKIDDWERQRDAEKLAEAQRDPAKMRAYQAEQAEKQRKRSLDEREATLKKERAEFEREKATTAEAVRAAQEHTLGMKLYEIAARYELNPEDLKKDMKDLNLTTEQQVENLAKRLKPAGERLPEGEDKGEEKPITPVSVPTIGGRTGKLSPEQFEKLSPGQKKEYLDKQK